MILGYRNSAGDAYLAHLVATAATIINTEDYGNLIFDLAMRRELIALGEDMVNDAFEPDLDSSAKDQIESVEKKLFDLATAGHADRGFKAFRDSVMMAIDQAEAAYKRDGKLSGVSTGLRDLDKKLGGLHSSDLVILAGRPSMGKTALATNIAFNAAFACRYEADGTGVQKASGWRCGSVFFLGNVFGAIGDPYFGGSCGDPIQRDPPRAVEQRKIRKISDVFARTLQASTLYR